jgi:hypothetical protein
LAAFLAESDFTALAAENDVATTIHRRAAAEDRALMQSTDGAFRISLFAALFAPLLFAAQAAQRDFGIGIVRVGNPQGFLAATRKREQ